MLRRLQREGYEVKRGKYISCRYVGVPTKSHDFVGEGGTAEGVSFSPLGGNERSRACDDVQERFTRLKTLGADYMEEAIAARITGRSRPSKQRSQHNERISLLIDIQNNIKAQQS